MASSGAVNNRRYCPAGRPGWPGQWDVALTGIRVGICILLHGLICERSHPRPHIPRALLSQHIERALGPVR